MAIQFRCNACGSEFNVPEAMAGIAAQCNRCGNVVTVPVPAMSYQPAQQRGPYAAPPHGAYAPSAAHPSTTEYAVQPLAAHPSYQTQAPPYQTQPYQTQSYPSQPYQPLPSKPLPNKPLPDQPQPSSGVSPAVWIALGLGGGAVVMVTLLVVVGSFFSGSNKQVAYDPGASGNSSTNRGIPVDGGTPPPAASPPRGYVPTPASGRGSFGSANSEATDPFKAPPLPAVPAKTERPAEETNKTPPLASSSTKPPAASADWGAGGGDELHIPFKERDAITFGPLGCPVVIVGTEVWSLETNRIVQTLEGEYEERGHRALSGDGRWFAAAMKSPNQKDTPIHVWDTNSGQQVLEVPADSERTPDVVMFTRDKYLMIGGRDSSEIWVWDVEAGKQVKSITFPGTRLDQGKMAFTSDGQYFAAVNDSQLVVYKTSTSKPAAKMGPPLSMERSAAVDAAKGPRRADPGDAVFVYAWLQDLAFSPDSQELAGLSTHPRPRLMCWDQRGKLQIDEPLEQLPSMAFWEHKVQWLPDKSGWIISGHVYDRATKRIVFGVRKQFAQDLKVHALDRDRLLGEFPHRPGELTAIQIPWDRIHTSLKAMKDGTEAILSPSAPVSVNIELAGLRGDQQETVRMIGDSLVARLARDGVQVKPGQPTTFQVRFSESAGDQLPIYERQGRFDFRGRDTGRTATGARGVLVIELLAEEEEKPLWRDTLNASNSTSFNTDINDASVRKSMLENLGRNIAELNIPYFIPKSEDLLALPVVLQ